MKFRKFLILFLCVFSTIFTSTYAQNYAVFGTGTHLQPSPILPISNKLTVAAWVYVNSTSGDQTIASWATAGNPQLFFRMENINSAYRPVMRMWNDAPTAITTSSSLLANTWYHIAVSINDGKATIYVNGLDETDSNPVAGTNSFPAFSTARFFIGANTAGTNDFLNGRIDDLSIWDSSLLPLQVAQLMSGTKTVDGQKPLVYLDFNTDATSNSSGHTTAYTLNNSSSPVLTANAAPLVSLGATPQSISFGSIPSSMLTTDAEFSTTISSNSGLRVGLSSSNPNVAAIIGSKIKPIAPGATIITAYQPGNASYAAATPVSQNLTVNLASPGDYVAKFDGSNYLHPATSTLAPFGASFSISAWIKPTTAGTTRTIASWGSSSSGNIAHFFRLESDNYLYYGQYDGAFNKARGNVVVPANTWSHVAMVKDNGQITFYVNGIACTTVYTHGAAPMNNDSLGDTFSFGTLNQDGTTKETFTGSMDNLSFFSIARNAASIATEFSDGVNTSENGIWGYWNFDNWYTPITDLSGNGHELLYSANADYELSDISIVPVLSEVSTGFVKNTTARAYVKSNVGGKLYWVVYDVLSPSPSVNDVISGIGAVSSGNFDYQEANLLDFINIKSLSANTAYKIYMVMKRVNNTSTVYSASFTTTNTVKDMSAEISAVQALLARMLPANASDFELSYIPAVDDSRDVFEVSTSGGKVQIKGSSASALTSGIRWYLGEYANASFSWSGDQTNLPSPLPQVNGTIRKESPYQYRYSLNYCTYNYTMSFWDWNRWEREIDLMAMQGINLALAPIGSEAVWQQTLAQFGYSFADVQNFIVGPAYTAWWLMGNLQGEGGKVSQAYIDSRVVLQNKILARMRSLGIKPILQGYAGMVPIDFKTKQTSADVNNQPQWGSYQRPPVLTGAFADQVAEVWYQKSKALFGDVEFYGGDVFHEGGTVPAGLNLSDYASQLQAKMFEANPNATWVLQAWQSNPKTEFLKGLKKDQVLILDYSNDKYGFWQSRGGFGGYPWVYGVINNFGGRMGIYARLNRVANDVHNMLNSPQKGNNVGIGIAPEAIIYNPVSFDLMWDLAWESNQLNTANWVQKFASKRYGISLDNTQKAWAVLHQTALNPSASAEGAPESIFNIRPSFPSGDNPSASCCSDTQTHYDFKDLIPAWINLYNTIDVLKSKPSFRHDLVDVTRQVISNFGKDVYLRMKTAINSTDMTAFTKHSDLFLKLMLDQDSLLRTNEEYLLGKWIDDARKLGTTSDEADLFELNARALPTTWTTTTDDGMLHDYAHHEWAGLIKDFYRERWKLYIDKLKANSLNLSASATNFYTEFEQNWINRKGNGYAVAPQGDEVAMAKYMYRKYASMLGYTLSNQSPVVEYQQFNLPVHSKANTIVGRVLATDADAGQALSYIIYSQASAGGFGIDSQNGTLTLLNPAALSGLNGSAYKLIVRVADNGTPSYAVYREISITVGAQNGPGGIGKTDGSSSLKLWLDADNITGNPANNPSNGAGILSWSDLSGNANHFIGTSSNAPSYQTTVLPAVNFDAGSGQFLNASSPQSFAKTSAFVLAKLTKNGSSQTIFDSDNLALRTEMNPNTGKLGMTLKGIADYVSDVPSPFGEIALLSFEKSDTSANVRLKAKNLAQHIALPNENSTLNYTRLGTNNNADKLNGELYEVLVFNDTLNTAQKIIIKNYWGAKFNISTLGHKIYVNDLPAYGSYKYHVAGIGKTTLGNVHPNAQGTGILEVSNAQNLSDNKFLLWGDNGGTVTLDAVNGYPSGISHLLNTTWRFNEVDSLGSSVDIGAIDLTFDLSKLGSQLNNKEVKLLLDRNANDLFSDETPIDASQDFGSGLVRFEQVSGVSNFTKMALGFKDISPLSVSGLDFKAKVVAMHKVQLNWTTQNEQNNAYFRLEKSINNKDWINLAQVKSKGALGGFYTLDDTHPFIGKSYYRITPVDLSGVETNVAPVQVEVKSLNEQALVYPNPTDGIVYLAKPMSSTIEQLKIFNAAGRDLSRQVIVIDQGSSLRIDLSQLPSGMYLISLGSQSYKVMKNKSAR